MRAESLVGRWVRLVKDGRTRAGVEFKAGTRFRVAYVERWGRQRIMHLVAEDGRRLNTLRGRVRPE